MLGEAGLPRTAGTDAGEQQDPRCWRWTRSWVVVVAPRAGFPLEQTLLQAERKA